MIEDRFLCEHFYHQQKLLLVLAAMRAYANLLAEQGLEVTYVPLGEPVAGSSAEDFPAKLKGILSSAGATELVRFEIEGKAMERRLAELAGAMGIAERVLQSPMFLCAREDFADFLRGRKKPQMAAFYKLQRTRLMC